MPEPSLPARRSVIVTGGTRRLGRVITLAAAEMGFDVVATFSTPGLEATPEVADLRRAVEGHGGSLVAVEADLADPSEGVIARIVEACPSAPYGLVNNAGVFAWDDLAGLTREGIEATLAVNLVAPMLVTSAFARALGPARGVCVFMLDQKVLNPYPDHLSYTVSKGGLHMMLAMCAREPGRDIRFYGIAPGLTIPAPGQSEAAFRAAQRTVPLGVSPEPGEIGRAVQFLMRGTAANGLVLPIDGGARLATRTRDFEFHGQG